MNTLTIPNVLAASCSQFRDKIALSYVNGDPITYGEMCKRIQELGDFLKKKGISKGDKVAILSENQPNWGICYFATVSIGAIAVPIMTEFHETQVHHIIRHSGSKAIFISKKLYNKIEETQFEDLAIRIIVDDLTYISPESNLEKFKDLVSSGRGEILRMKEAAMKFIGLTAIEIEEDDLAQIIYTSGTTGHSKGVMLTHKNIVANVNSVLGFVDLNTGDRMLSILPLFHTMESTLGLLTPLKKGATVYYVDKPPTAGVLLPALKTVKPTVMISVPLIIEKIYRLKVLPEIRKSAIIRNLYKIPAVRKKIHKKAGHKLKETFGGHLKMFCIGGAALPGDVENFLREAGFPYAVGYGLTETSPLVTGTNNFHTRFSSAGKAIPDVQVKIDNPDPTTGEGEILVKGPNVMKGYYKDPEMTSEVFTGDGWFRSGDLGMLDEEGYLYIKGRSKNVIIGSNGKNIYPEEVESIINSYDYVEESLVFESNGKLWAKVHFNYDLIDEKFSIKKLNESEARKKINELMEQLHQYVNEKVSSFSRLTKLVEQLEPFEKTPTKKIKRFLYGKGE